MPQLLNVTNKLFYWMLRLEESICCALAYRIICVNHIQRDVLIKRGIPESKVIISMNVPDPRRFHGHVISDNPKSSKNFRMVYFGTITKRLGIDLAIRAVAKLNGRISSLEFHILGEGDNIHEFKNLSKDLGIQQNIYMYDKFFPLEDLLEMLKKNGFRGRA